MELTLDQLVKTIPLAWNDETRGSTRYQGQHPAAGQALASALLIQKHCGGDIYSCEVGDKTYSRISHYINVLEGGVRVDVAAAQFGYRKPYRKFAKMDPRFRFEPDQQHVLELLEYRVLEILRGW